MTANYPVDGADNFSIDSPLRIAGSPAMRSTGRKSSSLPTQDFADQERGGYWARVT